MTQILPQSFSSYKQAEDFLFSELPKMTKKIHSEGEGLKKVSLFFEKMIPKSYEPQIIHVAGTSGKGTVASITAALIAAKNIKVGLNLSPYVYSSLESFQILNSDQEISTNLLTGANKLLDILKETNQNVTTYEAKFLIFLYACYLENCPVIVLETGLGGRYDASNIFTNHTKISVITKIGLDHMAILGKSLSQIAWQKAGIISNNSICFSLQQTTQAQRIIIEEISKKHAKLLVVKSPYNLKSLPAWLTPRYQRINVRLATRVAEYALKLQDKKLVPNEIHKIINSITLPGRFEEHLVNGDQKLILDGAHNAQKIAGLKKTLEANQIHPDLMIVGLSDELGLTQKVKALSKISKSIIYTGLPKEIANFKQAADYKMVEKLFSKFGVKNFRYIQLEKLDSNVIINNKTIIVTGSFFILAPIKKKLMLK